MLLVVTNHVALKSFGMQIRWSAALQFFLLFRMPLFFFISGFLAYKASRVWNARTLGELSLKKLRVQIIPTVVFFLLFLAMIPTTPFIDSLNEALASSMKAGYWFTLVLLYMLLTFYAFSYIESKLSAWRANSHSSFLLPHSSSFSSSSYLFASSRPATCHASSPGPWATKERQTSL